MHKASQSHLQFVSPLVSLGPPHDHNTLDDAVPVLQRWKNLLPPAFRPSRGHPGAVAVCSGFSQVASQFLQAFHRASVFAPGGWGSFEVCWKRGCGSSRFPPSIFVRGCEEPWRTPSSAGVSPARSTVFIAGRESLSGT